MLIGICDDEVIIRDTLVRLLENYKAKYFIELHIITFASGEELLAYQEPIDILFLDIQMKGMNGLQTAEKIREKDDSMIIIFLTGYRNFMQAGYRVKAFRYLLKPIIAKNFITALREAIKDLTKNSKAIVGMNGETIFVKLTDILYIEYGNRKSIIRTRRGTYESPITMNEWESILNNGDFFRVHKAYIVNLEYIESIGKIVHMENGEKVEVSIRQIGKLKRACKDYSKRKAR